MRLKRIELAVIALTLALTCFLGGYFTGRRSAVNIISVAPQRVETLPSGQGAPADPGGEARHQEAPVSSTAPDGERGDEGGQTAQPERPPEPGGNTQTPTPDIIGAPRESDGRININTASRNELMDLSGIGEALAGRIIDYRNQHGRFSSIEDIMRVTGIGERRFEAIKDRITVG